MKKMQFIVPIILLAISIQGCIGNKTAATPDISAIQEEAEIMSWILDIRQCLEVRPPMERLRDAINAGDMENVWLESQIQLRWMECLQEIEPPESQRLREADDILRAAIHHERMMLAFLIKWADTGNMRYLDAALAYSDMAANDWEELDTKIGEMMDWLMTPSPDRKE